MRMPTVMFLAMVLAAPLSAAAETAPKIDAYFGAYAGSAVTRDGGRYSNVVRDRDLDVIIAGAPNGAFQITSVVNHRVGFGGRRLKRKSNSLTFMPTGKPNQWRAAVSKPLAEGGPTILARLNAKGLHVYVAVLGDDGTFSTAVYIRKLAADGAMNLRFRRSVDGVTVRRVYGTLRRKKEGK